MSRLWALSGKMGSGKSTVARALLSDGGKVVSLATALKKMVATHMGIHPALPYCLQNDFKQLPVVWPGPLTMEELPRPIAAERLAFVNAEISEWIEHGGRERPIATVGALLQFVGHTFRYVEDMYWIWALQYSKEWRHAIEIGKDMVIDDVRYLNEIMWFGEFMGATVLRIVTGDEIAASRGIAGRLSTHASEVELDGYDFATTIVTDPNESDASLKNRILQALKTRFE